MTTLTLMMLLSGGPSVTAQGPPPEIRAQVAPARRAPGPAAENARAARPGPPRRDLAVERDGPAGHPNRPLATPRRGPQPRPHARRDVRRGHVHSPYAPALPGRVRPRARRCA